MPYQADPFPIDKHQAGLILTAVCCREVPAVANTLWKTLDSVSISMVMTSSGNTFRITGFM